MLTGLTLRAMELIAGDHCFEACKHIPSGLGYPHAKHPFLGSKGFLVARKMMYGSGFAIEVVSDG